MKSYTFPRNKTRNLFYFSLSFHFSQQFLFIYHFSGIINNNKQQIKKAGSNIKRIKVITYICYFRSLLFQIEGRMVEIIVAASKLNFELCY